MQRGLGGTALEPVAQGRDVELTLGPFMLAAVGFGLFALCALCFVFGYAVGHRGPADSPAASSSPGSSVMSSLQPTTAQSKPTATQNSFQPQAQHTDDTPPPISEGDDAADAPESADAATAESSPGKAVAPPAAEPVVHAAITMPQTAGQPVSPSGHVEPALAESQSAMVQIAAVSHLEDAEVLVGALRKRGYAVTAHRDPADGLIHVQVGPFATRADATVMRQKLLNDGYNAVIR